MSNPSTYTYSLTSSEQLRLEQELSHPDFEKREVPYARMAGRKQGLNIVSYESGKCVIQGKNAKEWITFTFEPVVLQRAELGYETILNPEIAQAHMGIDESGKGDFFGPLVIAAAYIDPEIYTKFEEIGVKDSKRISSDAKSRAMASSIRDVLKGRFSIVTLGPETYNRLYDQFGNLNKLLAWGHATAIEELLGKVPDCPRAIADQFGPKARIESALQKKGRAIELIQRTKAESDPAVAAASILARDGFLQGLENLEKISGKKMLKGASAQVKSLAEDIIREKGPDILPHIAKCHFKTAGEVLRATGHG